MLRIGLISDTHGLLRPEVKHTLAGVSHIVHAGDVGTPAVLAELAELAPVHAVRGNNDRGAWARRLPLTTSLELEGVGIFVLHDLNELDLDPVATGLAVIVTGHSHRPHIERRRGVLYVNPGSAGPRRFSLPVTVGLLEVAAGAAHARIEPLR
jgi:putative phosphoesterase